MARPGWIPVWSRPAALRAVRAVIVVCGLFALTDKVIGNLQMATFAAFGGFATLVLAAFGGTRREKLLAHAALAIAGSALLTIGTLVSSSTISGNILESWSVRPLELPRSGAGRGGGERRRCAHARKLSTT